MVSHPGVEHRDGRARAILAAVARDGLGPFRGLTRGRRKGRDRLVSVLVSPLGATATDALRARIVASSRNLCAGPLKNNMVCISCSSSGSAIGQSIGTPGPAIPSGVGLGLTFKQQPLRHPPPREG